MMTNVEERRLQSCDCVCVEYVFFFKQKTADEVLRSLVGSEMCIRDSTQWAGGGGASRPRACWVVVACKWQYLPGERRSVEVEEV